MTIISHWEYQDFVFRAWEPEDTWSCVTYRGNNWADDARQYFWETARERIAADLQGWYDQRWEALEAKKPKS